MPIDFDVIRRVCDDRLCTIIPEHGLIASRLECVSAMQPVIAKLPHVTRLRYCRLANRKERCDIMVRCRGRRIQDDVNFWRFKPDCRKVEVNIVVQNFQEVGPKPVFVPFAEILDAVECNRQGFGFDRVQVLEHNHRHSRKL